MRRSLIRCIAVLWGSLTFTAHAEQSNGSRQALSQLPSGVPIVMVNMLNYRDMAKYPDQQSSLTGEQAYARYREGARSLVAKAGGELVWMGNAKAAIIAPEGEHWDQVFMVRYPSREKFLEMIGSDAYQKIVSHRAAALEDSRLIATVEVSE